MSSAGLVWAGSIFLLAAPDAEQRHSTHLNSDAKSDEPSLECKLFSARLPPISTGSYYSPEQTGSPLQVCTSRHTKSEAHSMAVFTQAAAASSRANDRLQSFKLLRLSVAHPKARLQLVTWPGQQGRRWLGDPAFKTLSSGAIHSMRAVRPRRGPAVPRRRLFRLDARTSGLRFARSSTRT